MKINKIMLFSVGFGLILNSSAMEIATRLFQRSLHPMRTHNAHSTKKIVIIGAGAAGLKVRHELGTRGIVSDVYEAREYYGGRLKTHYFNDQKTAFYEEGGTFIDSDHKTAISLAQTLGVKLSHRGYGSLKFPIFYGGEFLNNKKIVKELNDLAGFLSTCAISGENTSIGYSTSLNSVIINSFLSPFNQQFLRTLYEAQEGLPFEWAPLSIASELKEEVCEYRNLFKAKNNHLMPDWFINKFAYQYTVEGGMSSFVEKLVGTLDQNRFPIHLGHVLKKIDRVSDRFIIEFENKNQKKQVITDLLVITLPFITLRDVKISPSVGLSELTQKAIQTLPYGNNAKIGIPTIGQSNLTRGISYSINLDDNLIGWPGEQAMTVYVTADKGRILDEHSCQEITKSILTGLPQEYSNRQFSAPVFKNWSTDPYARGSYSSRGTYRGLDLNVLSTTYPGMCLFAEPHGRLIFAGEHTRGDGTDGYVEGAFRSGISAAEIILSHVSGI